MNGIPNHEDLLAHAGFVRALARSLVLDDSRADDVAQETMLAALTRRPAALSSPRAWLAAVTRNVVRSRWRADRRRERRERETARSEATPGAAELASRIEITERLVRAVRDLPVPYRDVVILRYFEGRSPAELAAAEGCPAPTIRGRLSRALSMLRERLDAEHGGERRVWTGLLLPLAAPGAAGVGVPATLGATASALGKLLAAATLLLAAFAATRLRPGSGRPPAPPAAAPAVPVMSARAVPPASTGLVARGTVERDGAPAAARVEAIRRPVPDGPTGLLEMVDRLVAEDPPLEAAGRAEAGPNGGFRIDGLPAGLYDLVARAADGACGTGVVQLSRDRDAPPVRIRLRPARERLRGRAVHEDGSPFTGPVGAIPAAAGSPRTAMRRLVHPDPSGRFEIEALPAGAFRLVALVPGVRRVVGPRVEVPADSEVVFVVDAGLRTVHGRVVADADGAPVAGATIVSNADAGEISVLERTVSHGDGRFALSAPPGHPSLLVLATGFASARVRRPDPDGELVVRLFRLGDVAGRVLDADSRVPVAGVPVTAIRIGSGESVDRERTRATSGTDGRFRLSGLPPGRFELLAYGGGRVSLSRVASDHPRVGKDEVEVGPGGSATAELLTVRAGAVRGRVLVADGTPAVGVPVGIRGEAAPPPGVGDRTTRTDDRGGFAFPTVLPARAVFLVATPADGASGIVGPVVTAGGETTEVEIRLPAPRTLRVRVVSDVDQRPVAGALVRVTAPLGARRDVRVRGEFRTDGRGEVEVGPLPDRSVTMIASPDGRSYAGPAKVVAPDATGPIVLVLPAPARPGGAPPAPAPFSFRFHLTVVDGTGHEVPHYAARYFSRTPTGGGSGNQPFGSAPGREERRWVEVHSPAGRDGRPLPLAATLAGPFGGERELTVTLGPERVIAGRVLDSDGRGVPGVRLRAEPRYPDLPDGTPIVPVAHAEAESGPDGSFRLGRLGDRPYLVTVEPPSPFVAPEPTVLRAGREGLLVRLSPATSPEVEVVDADDRPVPGCRLDVLVRGGARQASGEPISRARTDAHGRARLRGLAPDTAYRISVVPPSDREDLAAKIELPLPAGADVVRLPRGHALRVLVRTPEGDPIPRATVTWRPELRAGAEGRFTDEDGVLRLRGVPEGSVVLSAYPPGDAFCGFGREESTVRADAGTVTLTIDPGAALELVVPNWPKGTTEQAWVREAGSRLRGIGTVGPGGRITFRGLRRAVPYEVCLAPQGSELFAHRVGLVAGREPVQVELVPGATLTGRLLLPSGAGGAAVSASFFGANRNGEVAEDGTFRIRGVPEDGTFEVRGSAVLDGVWLSGTARASVGEPAVIELR